jgi:PIN domain nuclease of toxin-antitoxin system
VLDASVLLALVWQEPGYRDIAILLPQAVIPAPSFVETLYKAKSRAGQSSIESLAADLVATGLEIEPMLADDCVRAAELIALSKKREIDGRGGLSLGDGLCIAIAERVGGTLLTEDTYWFDLDLRVPAKSLRSMSASARSRKAQMPTSTP